ncbi:unnamed protein product [Adineta steineri]|uniref:Uncharacterized protein n=1 Tax=Adineta steineri TaxID=433720 RepID=A0A815KT61_9BILA|nr:unnamed protein product [Adineta steineri]CAF3698533.1 unnamed protein product [Adineta steineri]
MTDSTNILNIDSTETSQDEQLEDYYTTEQIKQANASVNQDYSKHYVRLTIKIPQMRTGLNWRSFTREAKNGLTTKATYHGTRVYFEFIIDQDKPTETKYEYTSREPLRGPIEYKKSFLKYKDECVIWFVHKSLPW